MDRPLELYIYIYIYRERERERERKRERERDCLSFYICYNNKYHILFIIIEIDRYNII